MDYRELFELASYAATAIVCVLMVWDRAAGVVRRWKARRAEWRRLEPEHRAATWRAERLREAAARARGFGSKRF